MRKIILSLIFLMFLSINISARSDKFLMFDQLQSYNCEDLMARLDNFIFTLNADETSRGFIMVYEGKYLSYINEKKSKALLSRFGESALRVHFMQNYMINFRGFPKEKVLFISGGFRENHTVELWIVPKGGSSPKPSPTLKNIKYRKGKPSSFCAGLG